MNYMTEYQRWLKLADEETKNELSQIADDDLEIKERFFKELEFGTGGIRGIMGAGINRMNKYTVARATQGLANCLLKSRTAAIDGLCTDASGVAIAYDSRNNSDVFARVAACVLAANGIKVYLFESLRSTPELSFAVRYLHASAGIVVTASHNPSKYNGYKCYGDDGAQLSLELSDVVISEVEKIDLFADVKLMDFNEAKHSGMIEMIGAEVDKAYLAEVAKQSINGDLVREKGGAFPLVYTPFHGAGNRPVRAILDMVGFKNVIVVPEQELPDGNFPTMPYPNPEEKEGFKLGIELAKKNNAELIIATDPDCDRVGIVVKDDKGEYVTVSGNQVGILLTEYILSCRAARGDLPKNGVVIKTIVTSDLIRAICAHYGVEMMETLTGFKFIGEKIRQFEQASLHQSHAETSANNSPRGTEVSKNDDYEYVFGFEESYGYLAGTYARDKDAVVASMLIAEMAVYYKYEKGLSLFGQLGEIYKKYGYYLEEVVSVTMEGITGLTRIQEIMAELRANPPTTIGGLKVIAVRDYQSSVRKVIDGGEEPILLPKSNVLYFELENKNNFIVRPSGTEPKIKLYCLLCGETEAAAKEILKRCKESIDEIIA
ncbi:MAG: phospho-sugar mutase [Oscillospiraceae bacterium]|nr:phospho-sugar mutase [Oscillospiraceae bacterium]